MRTTPATPAKRLILEGPVGAAGAVDLLARARAVAAEGQDVTVDLSSAGHLHALALQVLVALEHEVRRRSAAFSVEGASEAAREAISSAGLQRWVSAERKS